VKPRGLAAGIITLSLVLATYSEGDTGVIFGWSVMDKKRNDKRRNS
jgi:hypothetical protein